MFLPVKKQEKADLEHVFFVFCNSLIYWKSGKQNHLSRSTTESVTRPATCTSMVGLAPHGSWSFV